ncbi:UvrD-helicase domain-containing protein [Mumia sp. zg.B21]|uniref:UvrD-helicase domain-containing protein n=1 Tax=Mumia sp. zg.B21 TaxID=2855447 RepID=UPI001C6F2C25|nr:UvrD-helicase domain-containing protein [Mumia sp. zg.B21]MBW9210110.1 UvrD-helicase domain-containing protein [Mumia sp. zg.B21]
MTSFDITAPLPSGTTLIEASAGTGKTWTLSALVVRYVAEQGRPLSELLIVTFSRAASQELRERVRARMAETLTALQRGGAATDVLVDHLRDCSADELAARIDRLATAVADFDTATIATIHQFCHYVLKGLGVAGDSDSYATLADDLTDLRTDVVDDLYLAEHVAGSTLDYAQAKADAQIALDNPSAVLSPANATGPVGVRLAFIEKVRAEVTRRKRRAALLGYDDLLTELADALEADDSPARRRMRERWSVVLVDEFQDTDPVQWQVFSRAFATEDKTLVLIGDPKQAIYAFRGGDVATYLLAAKTAATRTSLPTNYRSDAPLVDALQLLMANVQLSPDIVAHPITAQRTAHRLQGAPDNSPVRLRAMLSDKKLAIGSVRENVYADAAADIARLLTSGATFEGAPVRPQHIAVLAYANRDLHGIRAALRTHGIPSVLVSSESVLRTTAAEWWLHLMMALEQPYRADRLRLAALTPFLGWTADELDARGEQATEAISARVRSLVAAFHRGAIAAVLDVARSQGLDARVLSQVGGERDLTDIEHCAQLLQEHVLEGTRALPSLVAWLRQQSADGTATTAASRIMRLDSDALAVTLSTIHGSKGLQYPIVYAPFLFDHWMKDDPTPAIIHRDGRRVLSFDADEVNQPEHRSEALGENMRLAYVAMTRAQSQVVVWWAPTWNTANSALHRLLFGQAGSGDELSALLAARVEGGGEVVVPAERVPLEDAAVSEHLLQTWAAHGAFSLTPVDGDRSAPEVLAERVTAPLTVRRFDRAWVDQLWRRTSYSSLTAASHDAGAATSEPESDAVGRDDEEPLTVAANAVGVEADAGADVPSPMAQMPVGTTFGSLVHAVLEDADFQADDLHQDLLARIREHSAWWPVDVDPDALATALEAVCTTPLGPLAGGVTLVDLPRTDRFAEMDFELPLAGGDRPHANARLGAMAPILREHLPAGDPLRAYADALDGEELGGQALLGYLTGSIDLTFRHDGKFYVVDYKTNWLGPRDAALTLAEYAPARLAEAMTHSTYPLQAILYSVVLHRYLRWRLPAYDPDKHLGGVMYLYLRGMAGPDTPLVDGHPCGVFSWRPPSALLEDLSAVLDGRTREETR